MTHTEKRLTEWTIAASILMAAMINVTPTAGGAGSALTIQGFAIRGNEVTVAVVNSGSHALRGTVALRIITSGGETAAFASVTVGAGQAASVGVDAHAPIVGVVPMGVVLDDGVPF